MSTHRITCSSTKNAPASQEANITNDSTTVETISYTHKDSFGNNADKKDSLAVKIAKSRPLISIQKFEYAQLS